MKRKHLYSDIKTQLTLYGIEMRTIFRTLRIITNACVFSSFLNIPTATLMMIVYNNRCEIQNSRSGCGVFNSDARLIIAVGLDIR